MQDSINTPMTQPQPFIGRLKIRLKRIIKAFLAPILSRLSRLFALGLLMRMDAIFAVLDKRVENLAVKQADLAAKTTDALDRVKKVEQLQQAGRDLTLEIALQKRRLDMILSELRSKAGLDNASVQKVVAEKDHVFDASYFAFENRYRGTRDDIKKRQEVYLPVLMDTWEKIGHKGGYILDIGCGRGEFLELLKERGVNARGVDTNEAMVKSCVERGLQAYLSDAVAYLQSLENDSVSGIFAAQVIEHLPVDVLSEFVRLCFDKLQKGGKLIFETLNPECFYAMKWFYLDLSHQKPVHPQAISFFLEATGFYNVEVKYLTPVPDSEKLDAAADENLKKLNNFLFGFQEYAVIAQK